MEPDLFLNMAIICESSDYLHCDGLFSSSPVGIVAVLYLYPGSTDAPDFQWKLTFCSYAHGILKRNTKNEWKGLALKS